MWRNYFLAKHFSTPWNIRFSIEELQEFFNYHYFGCDYRSEFGDDIPYFNAFELVSEMGEGYPEIIDEVEKIEEGKIIRYAQIERMDRNV